MKKISHRAAAVALVLALSLPTVATAAPQSRDQDRERDIIVRVVKKIAKFFGFVPTDLPMPPIP